MENLYFIVLPKQQKPVVLSEEFAERLASLNDVMREIKKMGAQIIKSEAVPDDNGGPLIVILSDVSVVAKLVKKAAIRQVARSPQGVFRYGQFVMRDVRIVLEADDVR